MIEMWEIFVPTKMNNGNPIRTRHHREWDRQVRRITGGLTIMHPANGQWVSQDGTLYIERVIPVRFACEAEDVDKVIKITLRHYNELAVLAYRVSDKVKLVYRDELARAEICNSSVRTVTTVSEEGTGTI